MTIDHMPGKNNKKAPANSHAFLLLLLLLPLLLMGLLPAAAQAPACTGTRMAAVAAAKKAVVENIRQQMARPGAAAVFFYHFNGGMETPGNAWQQRFLLLQQQPQAVLDLPVHLLAGRQMKGAYTAFAREGTDGRPAIYLNENWLGRHGSVKSLEWLFAEELGHALDAYLNRELETPGDEGEGYALAMQYGSIPPGQIARINAENDGNHIVLHNREIIVEEAALHFDHAYKSPGRHTLPLPAR